MSGIFALTKNAFNNTCPHGSQILHFRKKCTCSTSMAETRTVLWRNFWAETRTVLWRNFWHNAAKLAVSQMYLPLIFGVVPFFSSFFAVKLCSSRACAQHCTAGNRQCPVRARVFRQVCGHVTHGRFCCNIWCINTWYLQYQTSTDDSTYLWDVLIKIKKTWSKIPNKTINMFVDPSCEPFNKVHLFPEHPFDGQFKTSFITAVCQGHAAHAAESFVWFLDQIIRCGSTGKGRETSMDRTWYLYIIPEKITWFGNQFQLRIAYITYTYVYLYRHSTFTIHVGLIFLVCVCGMRCIKNSALRYFNMVHTAVLFFRDWFYLIIDWGEVCPKVDLPRKTVKNPGPVRKVVPHDSEAPFQPRWSRCRWFL